MKTMKFEQSRTQLSVNTLTDKRLGKRLKMWYYICNLLDNACNLHTRAEVVRYWDAKLT